MKKLLLAFYLIILCASQSYAEPKAVPIPLQKYENPPYRYSIHYDNNWRVFKNGTNEQVLILICQTQHCDPHSQFIISTNKDPALSHMNNTYFMQNLPPKTVRQLLTNMVQSIGKLDELSYLKRANIGKYVGYQAKVKMTLFNGTEKILYYGLTFERGIFYNFQFFANQAAFEKDLPLALKLFANFSIENNK